MNEPTPVLEAKDLFQTFRQGPQEVEVLKGVSFRVQAGERIAIVGVSGSGKSTLLHAIGGLERPTSGTIYWGGEDIGRLDESRLSRLRNLT